jgi:uncharacterized membrane protein YgcG
MLKVNPYFNLQLLKRPLLRLSIFIVFTFTLALALVPMAGAASISELKCDEMALPVRIFDKAGLLGEEHKLAIAVFARELMAKNGTDLAVVTVENTGGITPKQFATSGFNLVGLGQKGINNGVMFLVVNGSRRVEVEVGNGARAWMSDSKVQSILQAHVIPFFKKGEKGKGIVSGVEAIRNILLKADYSTPPIESYGAGDNTYGNASDTPSPKPYDPDHSAEFDEENREFAARTYRKTITAKGLPKRSAYSKSLSSKTVSNEGRDRSSFLANVRSDFNDLIHFMSEMPWWMWIVAPFLPFYIIITRWLRNRPRICDRCSIPMFRLDEESDDQYLDAKQRTEEYLRSVDYDVWICPTCHSDKVERYNAWFSGYSTCNSCGARALTSRSVTLTSATRYSTGRGRTDYNCKHCNYSHSEYYTIPRIPPPSKSSSSSSSSYSSSSSSGGCSSGGGSGASW